MGEIMRQRRIPADRKAELLDVAMILARTEGYQNVTREGIASTAKVSPALVSKYFGTMQHLRRAIMSAALDRSDLAILAQGLVANDAKARKAKPEVRKAALERML